MKKLKPTRAAHTPGSPKGVGDYYGSGIRAKLGRVREGMGMQSLSPKKIKTPPKSLA